MTAPSELTALPPVDVVMATYQGAAFLGTQLGSLRRQTHKPRRVFIRDDHSTDSTPLVLRHWAEDWSRIALLPNDSASLGVVKSYQALLRHVVRDQTERDGLLAFCDQDDEWLPEKLERAARWHHTHGGADSPALYCSRAVLTDATLQPIGFSPLWKRPPGLGNALVENIALGCTVVMNRAAIRMLDRVWPEAVIAHDWWAYLVISASGGTVYFDPDPSLHYRQHGQNTIGMADNRLHQAGKRFQRLRKGRMPSLFAQAAALGTCYGETMTADGRRALAQFNALGQSGGFAAFTSTAFYRQRWLDDVLLRGLIAAGRIS